VGSVLLVVKAQAWLHHMVHRIRRGEGKPGDLELLDSVAANIRGRTICALGDAAAMPVQGFLKFYRTELERLIVDPAGSQAA